MPKVLQVFAIVSIFLTLCCLGAELYARHTPALHHLPYTHGTLDQSDDYADFNMFVERFKHFHQEDFFAPEWGSHYLYPATIGMLYEPFYALHPGQATISFLVVLSLIMLLLALWFRRVLMKKGLSDNGATGFVGIALACSYPFYFEFNRANVEIFIWLMAGMGVLAFVRNRPWQAATWIGLAGACKIYPFVYLGLLIARKQYKQAAWSLVVGAGFTIFSLWALTGNIAVSRLGTAAGLAEFRWVYVLHRRAGEIGLDHSIFGVYKRFAPHLPAPEELSRNLTIYLAVAAFIACVAYFARVIRLPVINQVMFLTIACIVLPPLSSDYTLLHVYTPFVLMVLLAIDLWRREKEMPRGMWAAFLCFTLLLAPLSEVIVHGERISGQIKCVLLLALATIALLYPFTSADDTPVSRAPDLEHV